MGGIGELGDREVVRDIERVPVHGCTAVAREPLASGLDGAGGLVPKRLVTPLGRLVSINSLRCDSA
jgi:hypothetical protein